MFKYKAGKGKALLQAFLEPFFKNSTEDTTWLCDIYSSIVWYYCYYRYSLWKSVQSQILNRVDTFADILHDSKICNSYQYSFWYMKKLSKALGIQCKYSHAGNYVPMYTTALYKVCCSRMSILMACVAYETVYWSSKIRAKMLTMVSCSIQFMMPMLSVVIWSLEE